MSDGSIEGSTDEMTVASVTCNAEKLKPWVGRIRPK